MRTLKVIAIVMIAASAHAQTTRDAFGPVGAPAIEAVIPQLYNGAHLQWTPKLAVVLADGSAKSIRIAEPAIRQESDGYTLVISIEFTDNELAVAAALKTMTPPAETSLTEIVAFKTTPAFAVTAIHRGQLATDASITRVVSLDLADEPTFAWPGVFINYKAYYATTDWVGILAWGSKMTTDPLAMVHRLPDLLGKSIRGGAQLNEKPVIVVRADDVFDIYSKDQARFIMSCAVPCVPDGKILLGLWGPTSPTIAATP